MITTNKISNLTSPDNFVKEPQNYDEPNPIILIKKTSKDEDPVK
jgi:hypothetical protein